MTSSIPLACSSELMPMLPTVGSGETDDTTTLGDEKYSSIVGGLHCIDMLIWFPPKHVLAFQSRVATIQSLPHSVSPVL